MRGMSDERRRRISMVAVVTRRSVSVLDGEDRDGVVIGLLVMLRC
jgi:hypothetical protein